ncbi:uncharacterized protein LOC132195935 [Neocloeon triangulifer]|uniref:uncharacterized protein LOC132195935 n=1 Tax=Neocloeon triangulifer TaxID=2078957 RepID=UPI00286EC4AC|nr:uncharacterized protein LOC132195935 [Neocloeon triangulifer]
MLKLAGLVSLILGVQASSMKRPTTFAMDKLEKYPQFCNPMSLMSAPQCINIPKVFSPDMFWNCKKGGAHRESRNPFAMLARKGIRGFSGNWKKRSEKMPLVFPMRAGAGCDPNCLAECVMNRTNHLDGNGAILADRLLENFTIAIQKLKQEDQEVWKPIVEKVVKTCTDEVANSPELLTTTTTALPGQTEPTVEQKACKSDSRRALTCLQRAMIVQAPDSQKLYLTGNTEIPEGMPTCEKRLAQLQGCDYNFMLSADQLKEVFGAPGGPGGFNFNDRFKKMKQKFMGKLGDLKNNRGGRRKSIDTFTTIDPEITSP